MILLRYQVFLRGEIQYDTENYTQKRPMKQIKSQRYQHTYPTKNNCLHKLKQYRGILCHPIFLNKWKLEFEV